MPYDEQGRLYYEVPGQPGRRSYVSPIATGTGQKPEDSGGIFRSGWRWDANQGKWVNPIDVDNIANMAVGSALGAGAISAASGGGAAAGGTSGGLLPNAALPGAAGAMTGAAVPAMTTPAAALGGAAVPGATGAALGSMKTKAGGAGGALLDAIASPQGVSGLAGILAMLAGGGAFGGGNGGASTDMFGNNPQLKSLMDMSVNRAQRTDPLHEAVTALAMSRLPTNVQR